MTSMTELSPAFWTTRYGLVKATDGSGRVARSLQHYGEWAEKEIDLLGSWIQEDHHVLESGSEYGAHAMWLARAVGTGGRVHVTEPDRLTFQLLCANIAINGLGNVYTHAFHLGAADGQQAATDGNAHTMPVLVRSVDSMALERLDLLKSNVPGDLIGLLAGAAETVRRCRPLVYARMADVEDAEDEIRALKEMGYRCWSHAPYMHNARNFSNEPRNIFPGRVWQNVVAAPTEGRFELDKQSEL